jgi:NAD dependent epimerase/dehydratase
MALSHKKVLVTGATGFIGSHLVQRLIVEGASVRAISHYRSAPGLHNLEFLSGEERAAIEVVRGDINDSFFIRRCVAGCDIVFHLAALIGIPYSYVAPASYVATNIGGTLNILEACRAEGTPRLVHTSTSECYGTALYTPIDEKHPLQGQSPYSASKIGADKLTESYHRTFELPVVIVRPFNTFGPRQSARAIIPTIIGQLLAGGEALELGDLAPVRDLTFVTDTVNGLVLAACTEGIDGELINLGTSRAVTIDGLANTIMSLFGRQVPIITDRQRIRPEKSEVMKLISDNRKAVALLKWEPDVSLEQGLNSTIEFYRQHSELVINKEYGV